MLAAPHDRERATELLRGAMHAGHALGLAGLALAHAMAQALGGTYGLPHGAMNALCLPPALAFNRDLVPEAVERFGEAIGGDAVERTRELARLGGFERLRDFGDPRGRAARARRAGRGTGREPARIRGPATAGGDPGRSSGSRSGEACIRAANFRYSLRRDGSDGAPSTCS